MHLDTSPNQCHHAPPAGNTFIIYLALFFIIQDVNITAKVAETSMAK
jgi:hypothetical protein